MKGPPFNFETMDREHKIVLAVASGVSGALGGWLLCVLGMWGLGGLAFLVGCIVAVAVFDRVPNQ